MVPHKARFTVEVDGDYSIFINDKEYPFYYFYKLDNEYGYKKIYIKVLSGRIKVSSIAIAEYYPSKVLIQNNFIDWFYSDRFMTDTWYDHDIYFYHLYPQGPSKFINGKPIWDYEPTLAAHLVDKHILTQKIRNMVCQ